MAGTVRGSSAALRSSSAVSPQLREPRALLPFWSRAGAVGRCPFTVSLQLGVVTSTCAFFCCAGAFVGEASFRGGECGRVGELPRDVLPRSAMGCEQLQLVTRYGAASGC